MTTPAPAEAITEKWLLENGFAFDRDGYAIRNISDCVYLEVWGSDFTDWSVEVCNERNHAMSVVVFRATDTARLVKLIEALTGKEWPCKVTTPTI